MGNTIFQKRLFTAMMCFFMVLGMTLYNIILHSGFGLHVLTDMLKELWIVYAVALVLDLFLVGPLAKKFVFSVIKPVSKPAVVLSISTCMVFCMVTLMSIFGSVMASGVSAEAVSGYPSVWIRNLIAALPLNLLIVSPLARALFMFLFPELREERIDTEKR
ncbi:MAG: DUF2798 domain-containing protein [Spirochaetales bacterium]|nr:DUF2798 domain-containing protein [Spirochaetales bacterium]